MGAHRVPVIASIAAATAIVIAGICVTTATATARTKTTLSRWEYHCVLPPGALPPDSAANPSAHDQMLHNGSSHPAEKVLNFVGSKSWELVAIDPNNGHYCFKRRVI